jgi:hypothetical protein
MVNAEGNENFFLGFSLSMERSPHLNACFEPPSHQDTKLSVLLYKLFGGFVSWW